MTNNQKTALGILGVISTLLLYFSFEDIFFKNLMVILISLALIYSMVVIHNHDKKSK